MQKRHWPLTAREAFPVCPLEFSRTLSQLEPVVTMFYFRARRRESTIHKSGFPLPTPNDIESPANLLVPLIAKILAGHQPWCLWQAPVLGSGLALPPKPKNKVKRRNLTPLPKPKQQPQLCRSFEKGDDFSGKKLCILTAIKPINLEKEKLRFFKSDYTYNPQFEYANPSLPGVLAKHSHASDRFLKQVKCRFPSGSSLRS